MKQLLTALLLMLPLTVAAQNPIIRDQFAADPTARVFFNGKAYLYPSHDIVPPQGQWPATCFAAPSSTVPASATCASASSTRSGNP